MPVGKSAGGPAVGLALAAAAPEPAAQRVLLSLLPPSLFFAVIAATISGGNGSG